MQHPRVAEYSGEPERKERGEGAGPCGQAIHDPQKIGAGARRALRQFLVRLTQVANCKPFWRSGCQRK
jgi:hypothetical protein